MKAKKAITMLPTIVLLLGGVTACGGSNDDTITFWVTFNDTYIQVIQNIVDEFTAIPGNEDIKIEIVKKSGSYNDLEETLLESFPAGSYPNMALCYPDNVAYYLSAGHVVEMSKYMNDPEYGWDEDDRADVFENLVETGQELQVEGTWCLPFAASTEAMFYNADVLIGLDLFSYDNDINGGNALDAAYLNNLTWEELFNHLFPALNKGLNDDSNTTLYQYINAAGNDYSGLMGYDSDDNLFITLAEQYGYGYTSVNTTTGLGSNDFNNAGMKNLMKTFNAQYQVKEEDNNVQYDGADFHYLTTEGTNGDNYTNSYFVNDGFLFSIGSTGGVHYQLDGNSSQVGVAKIPQAKGKETRQICQGPSICFFDKGDDQQTMNAWRFYDYLTNTKNTCYWGLETGYMPIRESAYTTDNWIEMSDESKYDGEELTYAQLYNFYAEVTDSLFVSPAFEGSSESRVQAGSIMTQCLLSTDIDAEINSIFKTAENQANLKLPNNG